MARALDERQQRELTAFVNALYEEAGYATTAEWARDSGYDRSKLSNLRNGHGAIDGYNLLRLIRAAAARGESAPAAAAVAAAPRAAGDVVADRLDEVAGLVTEALELLRADQRRTSGGGQARKRKAS